ncbi:hypothetical protein KC316_g21256 [Hortaea werneckii]|nr:hypothetical protein KC316_g21256 [Hortaea werneckii]
MNQAHQTGSTPPANPRPTSDEQSPRHAFLAGNVKASVTAASRPVRPAQQYIVPNVATMRTVTTDGRARLRGTCNPSNSKTISSTWW